MSDLFAPIRKTIIEDEVINPQLSEWMGEPACFTRRPVPEDAQHIFCLINPPSDVRDIDALVARRDEVSISIAFYGAKADPRDPADETRMVDVVAQRCRTIFHRNKWAIQSDAFEIIDIVASGPFVGPTDDDNEVARIVNLRVRLGRNQ